MCVETIKYCPLTEHGHKHFHRCWTNKLVKNRIDNKIRINVNIPLSVNTIECEKKSTQIYDTHTNIYKHTHIQIRY